MKLFYTIESFNSFLLRVNKKPEAGSCEVTPTEGETLITDFVLMCEGWIDPENIGIKQYTAVGMHCK